MKRRFFIAAAIPLLALVAAEPSRRQTEWKVTEIFRKLAVHPGANIADIGSGDGFLTIPLAEAVTPAGKVFAVDVNPRVLEQLKTRVRDHHLGNVEAIQGTDTDPLLAPDSLDSVVVLRAYHEFTYYREMLAHVRAALRPGGRLVVADVGPAVNGSSREEQVGRHVLASRLVERELAEAGFHVIESVDPFADLSNGERVWLIAAERPGVL